MVCFGPDQFIFKMIKKEIAICDKCKNRIAPKQCEICNSDICDDCGDSQQIEFIEIILNEILICNDCYSKLERLKSKTKYDKKNELKNFMIGHVRKLFIIKELERNEKREMKNILYLIRRSGAH